MKNRPNDGLVDFELQEKQNAKGLGRKELPNEYQIDITGKSLEQVLAESLEIILHNDSALEYDYEKPDKQFFYSWVPSNGLR